MVDDFTENWSLSASPILVFTFSLRRRAPEEVLVRVTVIARPLVLGTHTITSASTSTIDVTSPSTRTCDRGRVVARASASASSIASASASCTASASTRSTRTRTRTRGRPRMRTSSSTSASSRTRVPRVGGNRTLHVCCRRVSHIQLKHPLVEQPVFEPQLLLRLAHAYAMQHDHQGTESEPIICVL